MGNELGLSAPQKTGEICIARECANQKIFYFLSLLKPTIFGSFLGE